MDRKHTVLNSIWVKRTNKQTNHLETGPLGSSYAGLRRKGLAQEHRRGARAGRPHVSPGCPCRAGAHYGRSGGAKICLETNTEISSLSQMTNISFTFPLLKCSCRPFSPVHSSSWEELALFLSSAFFYFCGTSGGRDTHGPISQAWQWKKETTTKGLTPYNFIYVMSKTGKN
jgi:hypothetical protein